jgi:hypothetical protein
MERIAELHSRLQATIALLMLALAIWGFIGYLRRAGAGQHYGAALAVGGLLMLAEGLLGLLLLFGGAQPARLSLHIIYGVVGALALPIAALYGRGRGQRAQSLIYALTCLFLLGVAIRAYATSGG